MIALLLALVMQAELPRPILDRILDRVTANEQAAEERYEAVGDRLNQLGASVIEARESLRAAREEIAEARESWRPLQDLVHRLIALGWKLVILLVLIGVIVEGGRMLMFWLISRWLVNPFQRKE